MELFKKGILHRDVSPYNVLLGKPGAGPGYRGILIDFDIAIRRDWNKSSVTVVTSRSSSKKISTSSTRRKSAMALRTLCAGSVIAGTTAARGCSIE